MSEALLAIQMLHDRILIKLTGGAGERKTRAGILIPATAEVAKRLVWGEVAGETYLVLRERDLQAVASDRVGGGTGLYL